jgi:serine phosphatase RsbU (regulator of sigma subunit)
MLYKKHKNFVLKINFRTKIIFIFVLLSFLIIFFTQYISEYFVSKIIKRELIKSIGNLSELIRDTKTSLQFNDELVLATKILALKNNPDIISIFVIDDNNIIINSSKTDVKGFEVGQRIEFDITVFNKTEDYFMNETDNSIILCKPGQFKDKKFYAIITISKRKIFKEISNLSKKFMYVGIGIILISIAAAIPFSSLISDKVVRISEATNKIGKGNLDFKLNIKSKLYDELDYLAQDINRMTNELKSVQDLKLKNEIMKKEMKLAEQIQQTLLPDKTPEIKGYGLASYYQSAKEVGGDYYDWINIDNKHLGMVIADVSGKGVPGAFVMSITRSILRMKSIENYDANEVFKQTNAILKPDIKRGMFVTAWYGILNIVTGELKFTNAGHNPLIYYDSEKDEINEIKMKGLALGIVGSKRFDKLCMQKSIILNPGDFIFQYTDGITEAYDKNKNLFENKRLIEAINLNKNKDAQGILNGVMQKVNRFTQGAEQSDDISIIIIKKEA